MRQEGEQTLRPFAALAGEAVPRDVLRARIGAAYRRPETECLPPLIEAAAVPAVQSEAARRLALRLVEGLRRHRGAGGVQGLIQEYSLSSQEGVALMCLAEALLRIPDAPTRDALIRDKIAGGDWRAHLGHSPSLFVNAATWGLVVTGRLTAGTSSEHGLAAALARAIGQGGEPLIRKGVDLAMRMLGEQFVAGLTIEEALARGRPREAEGFRYSFDMLGEAALTADDAERYRVAYERAIHAIGEAAAGRGVHAGNGISIKLSALHPRYARSQRRRVMAELLPRLTALALLARRYDIGLNIDAEEADRLELSLDLLERLCLDPELAGWDGLGFVVQAYQKRAVFVVDWLVDLARRSGHRLMVRLVKGAYWDSEIKRAQLDGMPDFPVFTRKVHTDVSYLACAARLLAARDVVFPQFATHNARTIADMLQMAGEDFREGDYEFQCLHGMGEPLYEQVVGAENLGRPCRIYAPVGSHDTLLAYLVRRLLENGANTSFVHRVADEDVPVEALVADPVAEAGAIAPPGAPHPAIALPRDLFRPGRRNSSGVDLADEATIARLAAALVAAVAEPLRATPTVRPEGTGGRPALNPADRRDVAGEVVEATQADIDLSFDRAAAAAPAWAARPSADRAAILSRAADLVEARLERLVGTIVREAGRTIGNAVGEVREAADFLRYYAGEIAAPAWRDRRPLGTVICISPWNFPLAIFTGQVSAALAAGNAVLAKPAEETPLVAALAVAALHEAGVPRDVLLLVPGDGTVGAALTGDPRCHGVVFTGSTEVARKIRATLAQRLSPEGHAVPLIAETGGQNALIADSSALAEQVVADTLASAFDSAGQRCSAVRVLCLQEDVADRMLEMLSGAMRELSIGSPDRLSTDVGPVIAAEAADALAAHVEAMRRKGRRVEQLPLPEAAAHGSFFPPTLIEIDDIAELTREIFGPVLHVLRWRRADLDRLVGSINATGYGLTFGLHTRIDETVEHVTERIRAGNVYVNRNTIGAVVGVQPFGGNGLSGTGPKAGGPLYLRRLALPLPELVSVGAAGAGPAAAYRDHLRAAGRLAEAEHVARYIAAAADPRPRELAGPVGERNVYSLRPRGRIAALSADESGLLVAVGAILATGNVAVIEERSTAPALAGLSAAVGERLLRVADWREAGVAAVLYQGDAAGLLALEAEAAALDGPIVTVQGLTRGGPAGGSEDYFLGLLMEEVATSTNTAATGGNASLMTIG